MAPLTVINGLKFDNANNAAISLHVLAELVRRGELMVIPLGADGPVITLDIGPPRPKAPRRP